MTLVTALHARGICVVLVPTNAGAFPDVIIVIPTRGARACRREGDRGVRQAVALQGHRIA